MIRSFPGWIWIFANEFDHSLIGFASSCTRLLKIDAHGEEIIEEPFGGIVSFSGYGVAVTNRLHKGELA